MKINSNALVVIADMTSLLTLDATTAMSLDFVLLSEADDESFSMLSADESTKKRDDDDDDEIEGEKEST